MKLVRMRAVNFLGLKDIDVSFGKKLTKVQGGNGKGKSSVLKAIQAAFRARGKDDHLVIHHLEGSEVMSERGIVAEILVELDEGLSIRRIIGEDRSNLQVIAGKGVVMSPQEFLDSLVPGSVLNPVSFLASTARDRKKMLAASLPPLMDVEEVQKIATDYDLPELAVEIGKLIEVGRVGIDEAERIEAMASQLRKIAAAEVKKWSGARQTSQGLLPENFNPLSLGTIRPIDDLLGEMKQAEATNHKLSLLRRGVELAEARVSDLKEELAAAQATLKRAEKELHDSKLAPVDTAPIREAILSRERIQLVADQWKSFQTAQQKEEAKRVEINNYDALLAWLRHVLPGILWARAGAQDLSISFDGDNMLIDGVALDHMSTSEQALIALDLARMSAGELKAICVDGFEALDPETQAIFEKATADDEFQYIISERTEGPLVVKGT